MKEFFKKHKKAIIIIAVALVVLIVVIAAFGCVGGKKIDEANQRKTISLEKMDLVNAISATGTIKSKKTKNVSAALQGVEVKKVKVKVGDKVYKGQPLVSFDKSDLQDAVKDAQDSYNEAVQDSNNTIASAKRNLDDASNNYNSDKSDNNESLNKAKKAYKKAKKKVKKLKKEVKTNPVAASELAQAEAEYSQAKAAYDQLKGSKKATNRQNKSMVSNAQDAYKQAVSGSKKSVRMAKSGLKQAQKSLEKCAVVSPITGVVTAVNVSNGDMYSGTTLVTVEDTSLFKVSTNVDEYDISKIKIGQKVKIKTDATGEKELIGKVTFVAPAANTSSSDSAASAYGMMGGSSSSTSSSSPEYEVKIKIKDKDKRLRIGMTAKCSILLEEAKDVFAVPYDAVHQNEDGSCYINVEDQSAKDSNGKNQIKKVTVVKGMESDYYVEISGVDLQEGMKVVIKTDKIEIDEQKEAREKQAESNAESWKDAAKDSGMEEMGKRNHGEPH